MRLAVLIAAGLLAVAAIAGCGSGNGGASAGTGGDGTSASDADVPFPTAGWRTDFSIHSVPLDEFVGGGPPKDGIPSIDEPRLVAAEEGEEFLDPGEPVAVVELGGEARAYPLQILIWHEIVNDELGRRAGGGDLLPALQLDRRLRPRARRQALRVRHDRQSCATPTSSCGTARPSPGGSS